MKRLLLLFIGVSVLLMSCDQSSRPNKITHINLSDTNGKREFDPTGNPYEGIDVSPMDMSYYPVDYPILKMAGSINIPPYARVIYSRPHLQGRHLFHDVLKYGQPWRMGANEATELQLFRDATIMDKKIKAGRYILYCIPGETNWTIILNSNIDSWGLQPDSTKDIARFSIPAIKGPNHLEYYTMVFEKATTGADLLMAWEDMEARLPITF